MSIRLKNNLIKNSLINKLSLILFLIVSISGASLIFFHNSQMIEGEHRQAFELLEQNARSAASIYENSVKGAVKDLLYLKQSEEIASFVKSNWGTKEKLDPKAKMDQTTRVLSLFKSFIGTEYYYREMRLIGVQNNGKEILRVNNYQGVEVVKEEQLQEKSHRDYFKGTVQVNEGEVYIGKVSPRMEFQSVADPSKLQIRIGTPLYYEDTLFGILVVSLDHVALVKEMDPIILPYFKWDFNSKERCLIEDIPLESKQHKFKLNENLFNTKNNNVVIEKISESISRIKLDQPDDSYLGISYLFPIHRLYSNQVFKLSLIEHESIISNKSRNISKQSALIFILYVVIMTFIFYHMIRRELLPLSLMIENLKKEKIKHFPEKVLNNPTEIGYLGRTLNTYLKKILELNEELHDAQEQVNMGSWIYNIETNEIKFSDQMFSIFHLSKSIGSFTYEELSQFIFSKDFEVWENAIKTCIKEKEPFTIDYRCYFGEDKIIWLRSHGRFVLDKETGNPMIKATSQERTKEKLNQRNLELLAYASELGFVTWDLVTGVLTIDNYFRKIIDLPESVEELEYEGFIDLVHIEDKSELKESLAKYMQGRLEVFEMKYRIKNSSGEYVPILSKGKVIEKGIEGYPATLSFTFLNLVNIQAMEDELELQKKMNLNQAKLASIGELAAGVGHEINNPIMMAMGYVKKMEKMVGKAEHMPELEKIKKSLKKVEKITTSLRSFSRMSDDRGCLNLSSILQDQYDLVRDIYEQEGIKIRFQTQVKHACIYGSMINMQQVIMNLLSNARHAVESCQEKEITMRLIDEQCDWVVQIIDNGCGIPKVSQDQIFDAFYTTKEVGKGTGLGLSLSHKFVQEMKGSLKLKSEVSVGTAFTAKFPKNKGMICPKGLFGRKTQSKQISMIPQNLRIMVVEDEEGIRDLIEDQLDELGFDVVLAIHGADALQKIQESKDRIDLIISDMQMPVMDGVTFLKELRSLDIIQPKFIFMTAGVNIDFGNFEENILNLIDGSLYKPFEENQLSAEINRIFKKEAA